MPNIRMTEAFHALRVLNESDTFDLDIDGMEELRDFNDDANEEDIETIIDVDAKSEEELEDSYVGKIICQCNVCHQKIYKDIDEITVSEDDDTIVNEEEECPSCLSTEGFKLVGIINEVTPELMMELKGEELEEEPIEAPEEDDEIDEEQLEEALNESKPENADEIRRFYHDLKKKNASKDEIRAFYDKIKANSGKEAEDKDIITEEAEDTPLSFEAQEQVKDFLKHDNEASLTEGATALDLFNKFIANKEESLEESVEIHADDENSVDVHKNDDGTMSINVGATEKSEEIENEVIAPLDNETIAEIEEPEEVLDFEEPEEIPEEIPEEAGEEAEEIPEEVEEEIPEEAEFSFDEVETESFNTLCGDYLKEYYKNVKEFKTTLVGQDEDEDALIIEGLITFNSGNTKKTTFKFISESANTTGTKLKFVGENLALAKGKKSFHLMGSLNKKNNTFVCESLGYNYTTKNINGQSQRVVGTKKLK